MQSRFCGCVECLSAVLHMACRCCAHGCCCFTLPLSQDEIGGLFKELCGRLDALSNFSFTPKPVVEDMAVKANAPAITMEEVIPTAVSDAKLQAPEEVYRKKRGREGIVVGDDELSREEKKRRRRVRCWRLLFPLPRACGLTITLCLVGLLSTGAQGSQVEAPPPERSDASPCGAHQPGPRQQVRQAGHDEGAGAGQERHEDRGRRRRLDWLVRVQVSQVLCEVARPGRIGGGWVPWQKGGEEVGDRQCCCVQAVEWLIQHHTLQLFLFAIQPTCHAGMHNAITQPARTNCPMRWNHRTEKTDQATNRCTQQGSHTHHRSSRT